MGLGASQARLLTITSRLSTNEFRQQQLAMSKLTLSADKDNMSLTYASKINNQTLIAGANNKPITISSLKGMGYRVIEASQMNNVKKHLDEYSSNEQNENAYFNKLDATLAKNQQFLIDGLLSGYFALVNQDGEIDSLTGNIDIITEYYKEDDAAAEAEYESEMNKINRKEKAIDLQMRRLETEYSSLTVELNTVQNLVTEHTSKDFQLFS